MKFSEKLAKQRKANNLSQEQLAECLGVTRQSVSKWESGDSYPDMAKIMQLCKILNCPINDLLDDGVMGELPAEESVEATKKNYLEDFLSYVTKTYNMFIHMTWKSKFKMIFELIFIMFILGMILGVLCTGLHLLMQQLIYLLPNVVAGPLLRLVDALLVAAAFALGLLTLFHLFNIRYLDYYITIVDENVHEQTTEKPIEENTRSGFVKEPSHPTIVIRDPKHSSSRFFQVLGKVFRLMISAVFALFIELPAAGMLVASVGMIGFCLFLGGNVFRFAAVAAVGAAVLFGLIVYTGYNLLTSRKQPHRPLVITLISGLVLVGIGGGLSVANVLNLKEVEHLAGIEEETTVIYLPEFQAGDGLYLNGNLNMEGICSNDESVKEGIRVEIVHSQATSYVLNGTGTPYNVTGEGLSYVFYSTQDNLSTAKLIFRDISEGTYRSDYDFFNDYKVHVYTNEKLLKEIQNENK